MRLSGSEKSVRAGRRLPDKDKVGWAGQCQLGGLELRAHGSCPTQDLDFVCSKALEPWENIRAKGRHIREQRSDRR